MSFDSEVGVDDTHYYRDLALSYARGACNVAPGASDDDVIEIARTAGLRLHRFKRTAGLPRVRAVLGVLAQFQPPSLLDIGSGRGVFLWPLLDALPHTAVTAVDQLEHRVRDIDAVRRGGVSRLTALSADAAALPHGDDAFDAVTALEVLEHVADPAAVASEVVRVARAVVIASVPSKEDNNPEHIRLFTPASLSDLLASAGAPRSKIRIQHVRGHMVAVVPL